MESNLMHFKWEVTWTHGDLNARSAFKMGRNLNARNPT